MTTQIIITQMLKTNIIANNAKKQLKSSKNVISLLLEISAYCAIHAIEIGSNAAFHMNTPFLLH